MSNNATQLIHSIPVDPLTGAIAVPIYQTSTFVQEAPGVNKGYDYARTGNPTRATLEDIIAKLENGAVGVAFGSGLAAIDAVIKLLEAGDEILAVDDIYGGAFRLFTHIYQKFGITVNYVDTTNAENVFNAVTPKTKLIWIETPTNPLMNISDIAAIAAIAKTARTLLCVDNTFASPYLQNPLDLGADIVMHSATKYLSGHSDVIQGALMINDAELRERLYFIQKSCGAVPGPMDCFLILRGIKTLHVRMKQHCENGEKIAHWLRNHPKVARVYWPGFEDSAGYTVAKKQMRGFGGMISFVLKDETVEAATKVLSSTHLFSLAESLGGVESLINHPASMTHASIPREERIKNGLSDSLIRLSVGIEDADDLIEDLKQAIG